MWTELPHLTDGNTGAGWLDHHVELAVGSFRIVNQSNSAEINIIKLNGSRKIGGADPAHGDNDPRRFSGHHHVPSTAPRKGAAG